MREILFRGKRVDNGKWVEGAFLHLRVGRDYICDGSVWIGTLQPYKEQVDAKTVGQYTGLTDKNGKKIFEGDILCIKKLMDVMGHYYYPPLGYPVNVVVKWDLCAWMWETLCEDKRYIGFPEAWCHYECEVIGNIHDNPELLKGATDEVQHP